MYKVKWLFPLGSYGEIRIAVNVKTGKKYAAKVEFAKDNENGQLKQEYEFYLALQNNGQPRTGFPAVYFFGTYGNTWMLIMEMLGKNLEAVFEACGRKFSLKSILFITIQLLKRFEVIHHNKILYRDVKPENFLFGVGSNTVNIIDFGLSQYYVDESGQHIPFKYINKIVGTTRYMSTNAHQCFQQSRRDDLVSIAYVIIYFLRGSLPWSGIKVSASEDRNMVVCKIKQDIPDEELCKGFPIEFASFLK